MVLIIEAAGIPSCLPKIKKVAPSPKIFKFWSHRCLWPPNPCLCFCIKKLIFLQNHFNRHLIEQDKLQQCNNTCDKQPNNSGNGFSICMCITLILASIIFFNIGKIEIVNSISDIRNIVSFPRMFIQFPPLHHWNGISRCSTFNYSWTSLHNGYVLMFSKKLWACPISWWI